MGAGEEGDRDGEVADFAPAERETAPPGRQVGAIARWQEERRSVLQASEEWNCRSSCHRAVGRESR
jgi:hypothetical protein